nr:ribonuclease H-like domain-containing protein [Tanacetum cinerariifolium]
MSLVSPLPKSYRDAFNDPNWQNAMRDTALIKNKTWTLVPRPSDTNIMCCMWLFCHKYLANGTLSCYKARLVANDSTQMEGVDVDETFSPVVKPAKERINPLLSKIPRLTQTPTRFTPWLRVFVSGLTVPLSVTLVPRPPDTNIVRCMWLFRHKYLADDMLSRYKARLAVNSSTQLERVDVGEAFSLVVKPGTIRTILSLVASRHWPIHQLDVKNAFLQGGGLFMGSSKALGLGFNTLHLISLRLKKYAIEISEKAYIVSCKPSRTPVDTESKLGVDGDSVFDLTLYRSLAGSLQYLTFTRPDISYAVQQIWLLILMRIGLVVPPIEDRLQAKYRSVANAVAETCWLRNLLRELHTPPSSATLVYCDNISDVYLSSNPVQHQRTKYIEVDTYFVRDLVAVGQVRVLHVPSRNQFEDIFTKGLPSALFEEFRSSLSV